MRILDITPAYLPAFHFGGPIESVHQLNKWLVKKGVEVVVYTTNAGLRDKDILLKKEIDLDGVKVFYFPCYGYVHWTFSPSLFWALFKNVKNFDLVHITGVWNFPVSAAAFWARVYKKPYIISPRGSLMKEPLKKKSSLKKKIYLYLFSKRDIKRATAIHFTTEAEKEEYLKAGLPINKSIIIPNGLEGYEIRNNYGCTDDKFRKRLGIAEDARIVLFLGRLHPIKGLDTLIPAFAEVIKKEPKAILVLAGPDDEGYGQKIKSQISNLKISDKVIFTDMLLGEEKEAAFREADVFVLPSYSESFGMAVVEAMSFGLPVVITEGVGISPSINRAGAGLVINKDEKQLTEAILKILNNPELAKKMGENGKKLVETEFSSEKVAEKWIEEYNKIINV